MSLSKIIGLIILSFITFIIASFFHYISLIAGFFVNFWIFLAFFILLIIGIIIYSKHKEKYIVMLSIINIIIVILAWPAGAVLGGMEEAAVMKNAEKIITHLYFYKEKNHSFPDELEDLYPEFINDKSMFNKISYILDNGDYKLDLKTTNCGKYYTNSDKSWHKRPCP